jgi:tyrosine-protein kinase Etk/Wzc
MSEPQKSAEGAREDDEVSFLDLLIVLAKHKVLVLGLPAAVAVISAGISFLLPDYYTGITKILPPQQTQSTSAVLAQLGSLAGLTGGAAAAGIKNPNDLYVGMLKSRTVADNLIQRFDLNKLYDQKYQSLTRKRLGKETTITAGKDGIITIQVDDKDPKRAAELANGYVDELFKLTKVLAVTEASQRRLFFERQLEQAKESLAKSEASTRQALQKGGLVLVEGQGRVMAETSARLRAEITVKEIQIGAMRTFASDQNPELQRTQQQVEVLRRELARIEGTSGTGSSRQEETNVKGIENLRLLREMRYNEVTYELLAKQYEMAKIDEAKDSAVIQVMDKAIEPDRKSKPARTTIVLLTTFAFGILALLLAFVKEAYQRAQSDPARAERLDLLKSQLRAPSRRML